MLDQVLAQMPFPENAHDFENAALVGDIFRLASEMFAQTNSPVPLDQLPRTMQWIFYSGVWCGMQATVRTADQEAKKDQKEKD